MHKFAKIACLFVLMMFAGAPSDLAAKDTLVVGIEASAKTLDPHATPDGQTHNIMNQVYECLVGLDDKGEPIPLLAEKWDISPEGNVFTFYLRKGVKFHNGEELKADDVIFTFQRATGPEGGAVRAFSNYVDPQGLKKIDDYTVQVRTRIPMPYTFLQLITHIWAAPLSKKAVEQYGKDYGMHPVGASRFKFVEMVPADRVVFERFEDYYGEKAKLKKLVIRTILEASSRTIELESGAVDVIQGTPATDISRIQANPLLKVITMQGCRLNVLGFDVTTPPYNDVRVRKALDMAVDRNGLVKVVYRGFAEPAAGPISSAVKHNYQDPDKIVKVDIAKAKALLTEAGFPNGFKGEIWVPDRTDLLSIATVLQENFKQIGVQMEVKMIEWGVFLDAIRKKGHAPYVNNWWGGPPAMDAFFLLAPPFHSSGIGQTNRFFYNNPEVDALLDTGGSLAEGPERAAVFKKLWDILNADLPWLSLLSQYTMYSADKNLEGITYRAGSIQDFTTAYFKE